MIENVLEEINKDALIDKLTYELPVLIVRIGMSQDKISELVEISHQTYSLIEKKRKMGWRTFM